MLLDIDIYSLWYTTYKNCFLLHTHIFRMKRMYVERKWIGMHGNKNLI
jgi:hypothetical protein